MGKKESSVSPYTFYIVAFVLVAGVVAGGIRIQGNVAPLWAFLIGANVAAFLLCMFDKGAAGKGTMRVPEAVLFGAAVFGGTPGLLVGMHLVRHKTKKSSFQLVVVVILVVQMVLLKRFW